MAELLLIAIPAALPTAPGERAYQRGEVVAVQPDGHEWAMREGPPKFAVLSLPGVDPLLLSELLETQALKRRRFRVNLEGLALSRLARHARTYAAVVAAMVDEGGA